MNCTGPFAQIKWLSVCKYVSLKNYFQAEEIYFKMKKKKVYPTLAGNERQISTHLRLSLLK